jgi:hypothetical protein
MLRVGGNGLSGKALDGAFSERGLILSIFLFLLMMHP